MDTKERFHYPGLDALRGIAIILVILFHYFLFFRIGWIGVDLFFVLSGFLITSILLRERDHKFYFRNFYLRRILRIFPLYYLVLIIFFAAAPIAFSQKDSSSTYSYYTQNQLWFWLYFQNWLMIKKGMPPEPYLQHFWSLAIEEQFYIVWPFLVFFVRKISHLKAMLIAILLLAFILRFIFWKTLPQYAGQNYYNSFTRMDTLGAGALLALIVNGGKKIPGSFITISTVAFAGLIAASWILYRNVDYDNPLFTTIGYSVSALFFMSMCFLALHENTWIAKVYFLKPIGRISYGLYVFHLPVFLVVSSILNARLAPYFPSDTLLHLVTAVICIAITFITSAISYKFFELPLLRLKNKFRTNQ